MDVQGSDSGWIGRLISDYGPRCAGYIGLLSLAQFIICLAIGAFADGDWELFDDSLCYLGVSEVAFVRVLYPITCIVISIGVAVFGYLVAKSSTRRLQIIGYYFCIPFAATLIGIGLLNLDTMYIPHMVCVYLMGITGTLVIGLTGIDDFKHGNRLTFPFLVFILAGFVYFTIYNMDYQQPFVYMGMFIWLIGKCSHLIRTNQAY